MDPHDPHHTEQGYWPNDWPGYDPDRASIDDECAGIFAEREPRSRSGHHRASDATWARARADYLAGESASVVCDRYGMRVSTLRNRAAEEGWRRQDQPDPEPVDLDAELEAGLPDYADMAAHALIRLNRAILKGHATEAGRWMRLHRTLLDMARKTPHLPTRGGEGDRGAVEGAAPPPAHALMDALEAQVAEIQAMARSLARGISDGSDGSDGVFPSPPHLDGVEEGSYTSRRPDHGVVEGAVPPYPITPQAPSTPIASPGAVPSVTTAAPPLHLPIMDGEVMRSPIPDPSDGSDPSDPSDGVFPPDD